MQTYIPQQMGDCTGCFIYVFFGVKDLHCLQILQIQDLMGEQTICWLATQSEGSRLGTSFHYGPDITVTADPLYLP